MKKLLIISSFILIVTGCDVNTEGYRSTTADKFSSPVVLIDSQSNKFVVEHHLGGTYTVKPIK